MRSAVLNLLAPALCERRNAITVTIGKNGTPLVSTWGYANRVPVPQPLKAAEYHFDPLMPPLSLLRH